MLAAAIGDIHGNRPALDAVLHAIDDAGIQTILNTGDCVGKHPWPNEVVDLLRARAVPTVQGERDRAAARFTRKQKTLQQTSSPEEFDALLRTHEALRSDNLEFLAGLPRQRWVTVDAIVLYLCHGTPSGQTDALHETDALMRFQRIREHANAAIVVCGHSGEAFARVVNEVLFVNPGAVSAADPEHPLASYAVIDTEHEPWCAHLHRVPY